MVPSIRLSEVVSERYHRAYGSVVIESEHEPASTIWLKH